MAIHDIWLNNLKALVETEGGGDRRKGLRAVADLAGISEEYVYQLVEGKPKKDGAPRQVGKVAAKKIAIAFANGRPESWFDTASGHVNAANLYDDLPPANKDGLRWPMGPLRDSGIDIYQALEKVAWCISVSPHRGSDAITGALVSMSKEPESQIYLEILERLLTEKKDAPKKAVSRTG